MILKDPKKDPNILAHTPILNETPFDYMQKQNQLRKYKNPMDNSDSAMKKTGQLKEFQNQNQVKQMNKDIPVSKFFHP